MQISSLVGKRILTPDEKEIGYVLGVLLSKNRKKLSALVCADEDEEEFYLPARALIKVGETVTARPSRLTTATGEVCPIGFPVYSDAGKFLGFVKNVLLEEDAFLVLDGAVLPIGSVKIGDAAIVRRTVQAQKKAPKRQNSVKAEQTSVTEQKSAAPTVAVANSGGSTVPQAAPAASVTEKDGGLYRLNLLGRRVRREVLTTDGRVIAEAGETITPAVLSAARRNNRLLELTVNTLTNA